MSRPRVETSRGPFPDGALEISRDDVVTSAFTDDRDGMSGQICLAVITASLEALQEDGALFLSSPERRTFATYSVDRRRESYLRGRAAAKRALCHGFGGEPSRWDIQAGVFDQPVPAYQGGFKAPVYVSISHTQSAAVALAAPGGWPAAIDLETISDRNEAAIKGQMTASEREWCTHLSGIEEIEALTMLWSLKEVASKVLGGGLAIDFATLSTEDFCLAPEGDRLTCRFSNFGHLRGEVVSDGRQVLALACSANSTLIMPDFIRFGLRMLSGLPDPSVREGAP